MMATMTLTALRALCAELLSVRADKRALTERETALTTSIRSGASQWLTDGQGVNAGSATVYVTEGSLRRTPDPAALTTLALCLGATQAQIDACVKITAVTPSVRERKVSATDR